MIIAVEFDGLNVLGRISRQLLHIGRQTEGQLDAVEFEKRVKLALRAPGIVGPSW